MKKPNSKESSIETLRAQGHRITANREETLAIFFKNTKPISVQEIIDSLHAKKRAVNKTTVYREIDFLIENKIIRELDLLDGRKRYELRNDHDHHHHLVCNSCKNIQCVKMPGDLNTIEKKILKDYKFSVKSHLLEFFGLCENCQ